MMYAVGAATQNPVGGPASSTDNAIARFDGITGKILQNSGVICDDSNNVSGIGNLAINGRLLGRQGVNIASANDITLGNDGNFFVITGTTQINRIASAGWTAGSKITLEFSSAACTVKHGQVTGGGFASIKITGSVDYVSTAGSLLHIYFNGTDFKAEPGYAA